MFFRLNQGQLKHMKGKAILNVQGSAHEYAECLRSIMETMLMTIMHWNDWILG